MFCRLAVCQGKKKLLVKNLAHYRMQAVRTVQAHLKRKIRKKRSLLMLMRVILQNKLDGNTYCNRHIMLCGHKKMVNA